MWLVAGLGNPGAEYAGTRHNIGLVAAKLIVSRYSLIIDRSVSHSTSPSGSIGGQQALVLCPTVYMNDSGSAVSAAMEDGDIDPQTLLVIHDDIALRLGQVRIKFGGSSAGHNGLKSIDNCIGDKYWRIRVGVGHPGCSAGVVDHVLGKFPKEEEALINQVLDRLVDALPLHLAGNTEEFRQAFATLPPQSANRQMIPDLSSPSTELREQAVRSTASHPYGRPKEARERD